ncbi:uncharacterized protein LOC9637430 [Selaginella moellendorffii]|nr:uncharacterized protein LOC9637430 [Selaginella moellendorffii]|eukprot:XP_002974863.2 uncharacterized protein LOC9637430 [Selaginella moellendorffii]
MVRPMSRWGCPKIFWILLVLALLARISTCHSARGTIYNLHKFFCSVDRDGDGQIERHEATKFLSELDASSDVKEEAGGSSRDAPPVGPNFEFSYGGKTISSEEMKDHLQNMLTADTVVNWVSHGLQLPQYADAFQRNAINGLDFLSLIENDGRALAEELGVSSSLHRRKITGAIVRLIFGFGTTPGAPQGMRCQPSSCGGIQINWEPPATAGYPPFHKYRLYRWSGAASAWLPLADTKETSFFDSDELFLGKAYSYRMQSWGGHGPSERVTITNCTASPRSVTLNPVAKNSDFVPASLVHGAKVVNLKQQESVETSTTPWGWIWSVNGGLFLLGVLSRQSFFFRMTLAAVVVLRKFFKRATLTVYAARDSESFWLRTLARGFVSLCRGWLSVQRKVFILSKQACPQLRSTECMEEKVLSPSDSFRDAIGYSTPDCTIDEMLAAIQNAQLNESKKLDIARTFVSMASTLTKLGKSSSAMELDALEDSADSGQTVEARSLSSPANLNESERSAGGSLRELEASALKQRRRHRCNYDGCKHRFDRWYNPTDWRMRFSKHYCRECQRVFCVKHTRISPHGPVGRCGLDSTCVCVTCFGHLSMEVQDRLERINKLRVGPPVTSDSSQSSASEIRDPFPPDFSTLTRGSLYLTREHSSSGSLSSRSSSSSKEANDDVSLLKDFHDQLAR